MKIIFFFLKAFWILILMFIIHYVARKNTLSWVVKIHMTSAFLAYLLLIKGLFILYIQQFLKKTLKQGKTETKLMQLLLQLHPKGIQTHNLTFWITLTGTLIIVSIISGLHYYHYQTQHLLNFKFVISIITALGLVINFLWRTLLSYRGHWSYLLFEISGLLFIVGHALFYLW